MSQPVLSLPVAASEYPNPAPVEIRAAFDIGSGETKITVAEVNSATDKIVKLWHQSFTKVTLRKDLESSTDGCLSKTIEEKLIKTIQAMQEEAKPFNPVKVTAIGTSVFRSAKNSETLFDMVKKATGLEIRMIPQEEEGEVGFASAVAASGADREKVIAWDSGSGSFQISTLIDGKLEMYGAEFSFVAALKQLFINRNKPFSKDISPNPVRQDEALELIKSIRAKLPSVSAWLGDKEKQIVGIGGAASTFATGKIATGHSTFTQAQVMEAILAHCGKTDQELKPFPVPEDAVVDLILLYAVMEHCGMEKVTYVPTNGSCEGLLIMPRYWK